MGLTGDTRYDLPMWNLACRTSAPLAIGLLLVLGLAATAGAQEVRPFAEIQASPISVEPDPSGRSAILTVETSIDVACSVVYGTDASFGLIAVDDDMSGGAHADHHPLMGGLEPDTEYVYRVQGTAPDGTLYVSEVFTFTTPPAPIGGARNLALDATVIDVSSEFSDGFAGANAIDGDPSTEWSTSGDGDDAYLTIDLGGPRDIGAVAFRTRSMSDGSATTSTFTVTADDGETFGPFEIGADPVELAITASTLRFDVETSSGGNTGAIEIEVLAAE